MKELTYEKPIVKWERIVVSNLSGDWSSYDDDISKLKYYIRPKVPSPILKKYMLMPVVDVFFSYS